MSARPTTGDSFEYLKSGSRAVILGRGIGRLVRLLLQVVVARLLGPDGFGAFVVAWSAILIAQKSVLLGADRVGIRFGGILLESGGRTERGRFVALLLATAGLLGAVAGVAIAGGAEVVAELLNLTGTGRLVAVLGLGLPLLTLHLTLTGLVRGAHRPGSEAVWSEVLTPALNVALLFLLPEFLPQWALVEIVALAFVVAHALPALGMAARVARDYLRVGPHPEATRVLPGVREMASFALGVSTVGILGILMARADRVLVSPFLPADAVGLYAAAALIAQQNAFFLQSVATAAGPRFALLERSGRLEELRESASLVERWTAVASMPVVLLTIFLAPDLLGLMGPEFRAGWPLLVILSTVQGVNVTTGTSGALLNMTGSERFNLRALVAGIVVMALLVPAGAVLLGVEGAAVATGAAWVTMWTLQRRAMARRVGVAFPSFKAGDLLLPTSTAVAVGLLLVTLVETAALRAGLVLLLLPAAYAAMAWPRLRPRR
jgi:O-antigen/teichoic acid export membrane protein